MSAAASHRLPLLTSMCNACTKRVNSGASRCTKSALRARHWSSAHTEGAAALVSMALTARSTRRIHSTGESCAASVVSSARLLLMCGKKSGKVSADLWFRTPRVSHHPAGQHLQQAGRRDTWRRDSATRLTRWATCPSPEPSSLAQSSSARSMGVSASATAEAADDDAEERECAEAGRAGDSLERARLAGGGGDKARANSGLPQETSLPAADEDDDDVAGSVPHELRPSPPSTEAFRRAGGAPMKPPLMLFLK